MYWNAPTTDCTCDTKQPVYLCLFSSASLQDLENFLTDLLTKSMTRSNAHSYLSQFLYEYSHAFIVKILPINFYNFILRILKTKPMTQPKTIFKVLLILFVFIFETGTQIPVPGLLIDLSPISTAWAAPNCDADGDGTNEGPWLTYRVDGLNRKVMEKVHTLYH